MAERKLVTVERITELHPIEGADRIEVAKVRNWNVVVAKGLHEVGDLVAYFEIDSALDVSESHFEQFAERGTKTMEDGTKVHVLKTIKLRGQVSQGLIMPLSELPYERPIYDEGEDLTEILGIQKWEPPLKGGDNAPKGTFPTQYADKTDSERVQNMSARQWREIQERDWFATEKLDGTSVTVTKTEDGELIVASRNWTVGEDSLHYKAVVETGLADAIPNGYTAQGEIVGPGIQGNPLKLGKVQIFLFTIWDGDRKVLPADEWGFWTAGWDVPVLGIPLPDTIEEAVAQADGLKSLINPQVQAEGIVWHTLSGVPVPSLGRTTWKAINNRFLLKQKD